MANSSIYKFIMFMIECQMSRLINSVNQVRKMDVFVDEDRVLLIIPVVWFVHSFIRSFQVIVCLDSGLWLVCGRWWTGYWLGVCTGVDGQSLNGNAWFCASAVKQPSLQLKVWTHVTQVDTCVKRKDWAQLASVKEMGCKIFCAFLLAFSQGVIFC